MRLFRFLVLSLVVGNLSAWADPTRHRGPVTALLSVNGEIYSCSQSGVFRGIGEKQNRVIESGFRVLSLAVAKGNNELILAGGIPGESGIIASWNVKTRIVLKQDFADDLAYSVAASHNAIFAALSNGEILEIDDDSGEKPKVRHRHTATARTVQVSPDGKHLASAGMDRVVLVSNLEKSAGLEPVIIQDHTGGIDCLVFSPESTLIASGAKDGKVRIHFSEGGKLVRTYRGLKGQVSALTWGERLVAGTSSGCIYELGETHDSAVLLQELGPDSPVTALALVKGGLIVGIPHRVLTELRLKPDGE